MPKYDESEVIVIISLLMFKFLEKQHKPVSSAEYIKTLNIVAIIHLIDHYPSLETLFKTDSLNVYWENQITLQGVIENPYYHMRPQKKIHPFDLMRAIFYTKVYLQYQLEPEDSFVKDDLEATEILKKAADLGSFYAICKYLQKPLLDLKARRKNEQDDLKIGEKCEDIAKSQGTPGHLLASFAYLTLGRNFGYMFNHSFDSEIQRKADLCYKISLYHFYMAGLLETASVSAINNAFFGMPLIKGFNSFYGTDQPIGFFPKSESGDFSENKNAMRDWLFQHCVNKQDQIDAQNDALLNSKNAY